MLPNLLVIGAPKTGTTSLHNYLGQHPEIFMSRIKEPGFFVFEGSAENHPALRDSPVITTIEKYEALFSEVRNEKIIGESSPQYLQYASEAVIHRIKRWTPEAKFIAILRHPVDQLYSGYQMIRRDGYLDKDIDFKSYILNKMGKNQHENSNTEFENLIYSDKIQKFTSSFDHEHISINLYDDFIGDQEVFLRKLFTFLEVDTNFKPDFSKRLNTARVHKYRVIEYILNKPNPIRFFSRRLIPDHVLAFGREKLRDLNFAEASPLDPAVRTELTKFFEEEILRLQELIDRDLSHWIQN